MPKDPRTYRMQVRVRYAETDRMGFLHHSRYFVILEMARTEALREHGLAYRDLEDAGCFLVVAQAECKYRAPARYDDVLTVETHITRLTASAGAVWSTRECSMPTRDICSRCACLRRRCGGCTFTFPTPGPNAGIGGAG